MVRAKKHNIPHFPRLVRTVEKRSCLSVVRLFRSNSAVNLEISEFARFYNLCSIFHFRVGLFSNWGKLKRFFLGGTIFWRIEYGFWDLENMDNIQIFKLIPCVFFHVAHMKEWGNDSDTDTKSHGCKEKIH